MRLLAVQIRAKTTLAVVLDILSFRGRTMAMYLDCMCKLEFGVAGRKALTNKHVCLCVKPHYTLLFRDSRADEWRTEAAAFGNEIG